MQLALQAQPANWNNCISCSCPPRPPLPPPSLTYSQLKVYAPVSLINLKVWSWIKQCWQFGTWWKYEIIDQWPVNYSRLTALQQQVLVMSSRSGLCNGVLNQCWSLISVSLGQTGLVFWAQPELPSRKTLWSLICPPLLLSSHALLVLVLFFDLLFHCFDIAPCIAYRLQQGSSLYIVSQLRPSWNKLLWNTWAGHPARNQARKTIWWRVSTHPCVEY